MPYKNAYIWILLLFPAVGLAFWPGYFSRLNDAPWIAHAHGITASLWLALTALQAWSISRERGAIHRMSGRASLVLFPLYWTSGLLIVQAMAAGFITGDNLFHSTFGARLVPVDALASGAILYLYFVALSERRSVLTHAAAMLAIPLFLLPPIFVRILPIAGPFSIRSAAEVYKFGYALDACNLACILVAVWLWSRRPRTAWPFLVAAGVVALQTLAFETFGRSAAWGHAIAPLATMPTALVTLGSLVLSAFVVWLGWTSIGRKGAVNNREPSSAPDMAVGVE